MLHEIDQCFEGTTGCQHSVEIVKSQQNEKHPCRPVIEMTELPGHNNRCHDQIELCNVSRKAGSHKDGCSSHNGEIIQSHRVGNLVHVDSVTIDSDFEHDTRHKPQYHRRSKHHVPNEDLHATVLV